jgi:TolB-like protein/Tfp pilus assembly protein PilF
LDFQDEAERSTAYSFTGSEPLDSIAVLPFVNVTADPNTEYLSDGISESLINALSRLPKLRVIPRSLVFRYKGKDVDPQAIGRELGVRAVLTGRVIQRGDSLNIQTELIDVANVSQLWGEQYNRKFADILDVQEEITRQLSEKLRIKLTGEERKGLTKRHTENTEAYQLYLKGDYYFNKNTPQGCDKAIEYLQQAIEKDPRYALAYSRLATSYGMLNVLSTLGTVPPKELYSRAKAAAAKALELDDTLADAHVAAAWIKFYYDWDFVDAEREFRRSIQLDPDYALAHHVYAWYLLAMGRQDEAFAEIKRAQELDPTSIWVASSVGGIFLHLRQYDRAIEELRKAIEMDPHFALTHIYLAEVYRLKGMNEEALIEYHKAATLYGVSPGIVAARKEAYTRFGWKGFWQKQLDMNKEQANASYVRAWYLAVPYGYLGDKDQAFNWLQKAYEERDSFLVFLNTGLPQLDNLRSDPKFAELMRKIGFTL